MVLQDKSHPYTPGAPAGPESYLLVWDAPNLDMGLGAILGSRPTAAYRPRFDAIGRWLIDLAQERSAAVGSEVEPEATVFTNVSPASADAVRPWVEALRNVGFAVFAKPKVDEDSDVDQDMLDHIQRRQEEGVLRGVVVASADGQNFQEPIEQLADAGIPVTVLGFHEHAAWAVQSETIDFVDLEDIPGVFREPLPRINLDQLPEGGAWMQPFRPLSALLHNKD
ncbi:MULTISPECIES: NYN domain-containing protein [Corynebacterium]|uniref:NYN domain-containing protein n=1 Tax=Corynebacterium TaxID=1716 RepID=UPI0008A5EDF6|nr:MULTISPECIES: NYN domain-containing protein [Corynebacterium]MCG7279350.1 NYN domain-containing protein [Corynebacterium imitans]MDK8307277.1 NYN domain-containing protein [Corynebacterium imitans]MDK8638480.1 NYN domain-containing protein [Corynebacterium imitans]MDK8773684.1 NYN domain-containing protein [Corynebacterium imitans]OFP37729.1 NYN domain-containing protein [Corynebacterium sp. HMSC071B10]